MSDKEQIIAEINAKMHPSLPKASIKKLIRRKMRAMFLGGEKNGRQNKG